MNLLTPPDKFEKVAMESRLCVCVLGDATLTDIEFVRVRPSLPQLEERVAELRDSGRGLHFVGVIGLRDGVPASAFAEPLSERQTSALAQAFLAYLNAWFTPEPQPAPHDDSVAWLEALYRLPDNRTEV